MAPSKTASHDVSTEKALNLLADARCRSILARLIDCEDNTVSLDTLVTQIAPDNPPPAIRDADHLKPLLIDLHHRHLPRLEDAGLIEYDARSKTICYHPNEDIEKLHQFITSEYD